MKVVADTRRRGVSRAGLANHTSALTLSMGVALRAHCQRADPRTIEVFNESTPMGYPAF